MGNVRFLGISMCPSNTGLLLPLVLLTSPDFYSTVVTGIVSEAQLVMVLLLMW